MWSVIKSEVVDENSEIHETFGVKCGETEIKDISLDRKKVEEFAEKLNKYGASEIHASELAEDFIVQDQYL